MVLRCTLLGPLGLLFSTNHLIFQVFYWPHFSAPSHFRVLQVHMYLNISLIYLQALKSLQKYPLVLRSGKDCKMLEYFGMWVGLI